MDGRCTPVALEQTLDHEHRALWPVGTTAWPALCAEGADGEDGHQHRGIARHAMSCQDPGCAPQRVRRQGEHSAVRAIEQHKRQRAACRPCTRLCCSTVKSVEHLQLGFIFAIYHPYNGFITLWTCLVPRHAALQTQAETETGRIEQQATQCTPTC